MPNHVTERDRSAEQFRVALEAAPTGMLMIDATGRIALVNAQVERIFGYSREELLNEPVEMLVPERFRADHPDFRSGFFQAPGARPMGRGRDLFGLRKDGTEVPIEIGLNPLTTLAGSFVLSSVVDITERKRSEAEKEALVGQLQSINADLEARVQRRTRALTAALLEREVLLKEVHHRVKNNLQIISSLLSMQARTLAGGASRDAVEECQARVQAIALIHEQLYRSKDYGRLAFSEYARNLASSVFVVAGVSKEAVSLELAVEDVVLPVGKAISCGLVLNELITNALRHGFPGGRSGWIQVEVSAIGETHLRLAVRDNGIGLPAEIDVGRSKSLGLQLVHTLAEQLDAVLEVDGRAGASFQLTFPSRPDSE